MDDLRLRNPNSTFQWCQVQYIWAYPPPVPSTPPVAMMGNCVGGGIGGQSFILNGLGQTFDTHCNISPPQSNSDLRLYGALVPRAGTITNLVAKQDVLSGTVAGGTVQVWINPNSTNVPFLANIQCTLPGTGSCSTTGSQAVNAGDQVIVIVNNPSTNNVLGPVSAVLTIS